MFRLESNFSNLLSNFIVGALIVFLLYIHFAFWPLWADKGFGSAWSMQGKIFERVFEPFMATFSSNPPGASGSPLTGPVLIAVGLLVIIVLIFIGLIIDAVGHTLIDRVYLKPYEMFYWVFDSRKDLSNQKDLIKNYIKVRVERHAKPDLSIPKQNDSILEQMVRTFFYTRATASIWNYYRGTWIFFEFYRNVGVTILAYILFVIGTQLYSWTLPSYPILWGIGIVFLLLLVWLICHTVRFSLWLYHRIEVEYVVGCLLNLENKQEVALQKNGSVIHTATLPMAAWIAALTRQPGGPRL